jgi:hypothetical protein
MRIFARKRKEIMNRRIVLIVLAALTLIATGCANTPQAAEEPASPAIHIAIKGAPESAVLVGEKFTLNAEIWSEDTDAEPVLWSSSNPAVAKVNAKGRVLAIGGGECEISATAGKAFGKVTISVTERDPANDEMGHVGSGKTDVGRNNGDVLFSIGSTRLVGYLFYQGGNNSMTYYDNGTFKADWNATNDFIASVGYDYGSSVNYQDMQYDCYFRHSKTGTAGGYNYIGIHGWTLDPLVEFFIIDDWFVKSSSLFGQKMGEFTIDGDNYEIYKNQKYQSPSILGELATYSQYFSVRNTARQSGHINISAHFNKWESLEMPMGDNMRQLMYYIEVGGGSGSVDCTYLFMSDGQF